MKIPEDSFLAEDVEEINSLADSIDSMAQMFAEGPTTEGLRMAAALFHAGANRLELVADRVEKEAENNG